MPTKKELVQQAQALGLCCFWKLNKQDLETLVTQAVAGNIPEAFLGRKKIGDACADNSDCRSRRCHENKCVSMNHKDKIKIVKVDSDKPPTPLPQPPPPTPKSKTKTKLKTKSKSKAKSEPKVKKVVKPKVKKVKVPQPLPPASVQNCTSSKMCNYFS